MPSYRGLREQIKDNARIIYPQINDFIIIIVEDTTYEPGTRIWKAMLVTRNPDRGLSLLVGGFGGRIREALVVLLMATAQMLREIGV